MSIFGRAIIVSAALLLGVGCGPSGDDDGLPACAAGLLAGDLVITEVFADAVGEDEGKEWFEIYNATNQTLDLAGVVLTASRASGEDPATHVMTQQIIDPGQYLVLGGVAAEFRPSYVDYGYGADLRVGSSRGLPNSDGRLELRCDVITVDEMTWGATSSGKSKALDGSRVPDYNANDDRMLWCDSVTEFELGSFGTPRGPNDACSTITPTMCNDGGSPRELVSPELGDVVITEYMARPSSPPGAANGEWLELAITRDVDLNGLQLGQAEPDTGPKNVSMALSSPDCLRVTAGSYVLLARSNDPLLNGGLPAVDHVLSFGLTDSNDGVFVGFDGGILDVVTWTTTRPQGRAVGLDPEHTTPSANDDDLYWCNAVDTYGTDGQFGTPKAANPSCNLPLEEGKCEDENGIRDIVDPVLGDLIISEVMPDSLGGSPDLGEWFEIYVARDVDFSGLQVGRHISGSPSINTLPTRPCNRFQAGSHVLVARSADALQNGGLPAVDFTFSFILINSNGDLFVRDRQGTFLDTITWTSSTRGVSSQLDPRRYDPVANDLAANWCPSTQVYDSTRLGTPGSDNEQCPGVMD